MMTCMPTSTSTPPAIPSSVPLAPAPAAVPAPSPTSPLMHGHCGPTCRQPAFPYLTAFSHSSAADALKIVVPRCCAHTTNDPTWMQGAEPCMTRYFPLPTRMSCAATATKGHLGLARFYLTFIPPLMILVGRYFVSGLYYNVARSSCSFL